MKKAYKVISIITTMLMVLCICANVFASTVSIDKIDSQKTIDASAASSMEKFGGTILGYITNAAILISVIMVAVLGIKYMMGSAEEKAEYKKSFMPLLIGAILVFGAATVAKIFVGLATSFK